MRVNLSIVSMVIIFNSFAFIFEAVHTSTVHHKEV